MKMDHDDQAAPRPRTATLLVPATAPRQMAGARRMPADQLTFDLASAATPEKDTARAAVADALLEHDYGDRTVSVRINSVATMWAYRDVVDVVERAGEFVDCITVPGVTGPGDVDFVDTLVRMISERLDLAHLIGIEAQIDNPAALTLLDEIALSSERLEALVFDAAAMGAALGTAGPGHARHGDPWHAIRVQVLVAARAAGLQAVEAHGAALDAEAFRAAAQRSRDLGYDGVTCTHPDRLEPIRDVFAGAGK